MLSITEIEKRGGQVVAGRVILDGEFVPGVFTEDGFSPAAGGPFDPKVKASKAKAAEAAADAAKE